jgi:phosphate transport system substrate-binding protein
MNKAVRIILFIVLEAVVIFAGLFLEFLLLFISGKPLILILCLVLTFVSVLGVAFWMFARRWRKITLVTLGVIYFFSAIIAGASFLGEHFDSKIPTVADEVDVRRFYPFSESLPRLSKPASLKIDAGDLPVMDGALALYPLYATFATALYPKDDYRLDYWEGSRCAGNPCPVALTNTIEAFNRLLNGEVDIYFMSEISKEQAQKALDKGIRLKYTPLGKEAFVFFVNSKNPIDNLTVDQVRKIYSGEITRWEAMDSRYHGTIKAFQRNPNSGSQTALIRLMGETPLMNPPKVDQRGGMGDIIRVTADYKNYKNAIGFSFRYFTNVMVKNQEIKLLKINGVAPTLENIHNGSYPLAAKFYAITREDNKNANVDKMLLWFQGEEARELIYRVLSES